MSTNVITERTAEVSPRLKARIAGVLLAIAGLCYLTNSFANFLSPEFAAHLSPYILIPGVVEIVLALWLFVMGVYAERWKEQASAAGGVHPHMKAAVFTRYGPTESTLSSLQPRSEHCPVYVLGEPFLSLWLLMKGVNVEQWEKRPRESA